MTVALPDHSLRRLLNWGPLTTLFLIFYISGTAVYCHNVWWPLTTNDSRCHATAFLSSVALILLHYLRASFVGPGYLPLGWNPRRLEDRAFLQFCEICRGYKAPRAHHCRQCRRCVKKMDHHCPWIGNCLGHDNHASFLLFLLFAVVGCSHASVILGVMLARTLFWSLTKTYGSSACRQLQRENPGRELFAYLEDDGSTICSWWPTPDSSEGLIIAAIAAWLLAIGVALSLLFMFIGELQAVLRNRTGIEDWIVEKAESRREVSIKRSLLCGKRGEKPNVFVYPYDLGWRENLGQVFGRTSGSGVALDGVVWPTVPGCNPYALTIEQLEQKAEKKRRATRLVATDRYSGRYCAGNYGWSIRCAPFCCEDEGRLALAIGDEIRATREDGDWIYGMREAPAETGVQEKGWFPAAAVQRIPVAAKKKT